MKVRGRVGKEGVGGGERPLYEHCNSILAT